MQLKTRWHQYSFFKNIAFALSFLALVQCQQKNVVQNNKKPDTVSTPEVGIRDKDLPKKFELFTQKLAQPDSLSMQEKIIWTDSTLKFIAQSRLSEQQYFVLGQQLQKLFVGTGYILVENNKNAQTFSVEDYVHRLSLLASTKKLQLQRKKFSLCAYKEIDKDKHGRWVSYSHIYQADSFDAKGIPVGRHNIIQVPIVPIDTLGTDFDRIMMLQMAENLQ